MNISLRKLSTRELATFTRQIISTSRERHEKLIGNHALLMDLEKSFNDYDSVYVKTTFSGIGKNVATSDKERYDAFNNLRLFFNGYTKLVMAPHYQSALALQEVFKNYGLGIDKMKYSEKSAQLIKLIEILDLPENQAHFTNLGILSAFTLLKNSQNAFEDKVAQQAEANSELRKITSATKKRTALEKYLKKYLDLVTIMRDIPAWADLYADLNEYVKTIRK